jgi:pimeloyl-ACP methyl ester carboxylesterase
MLEHCRNRRALERAMIPTPHRQHRIAFSVGDEQRRMAVHEWGDTRNARVVVCAHGVTRNGRDFDVIADALCSDYRVLCPDFLGRGESDWLATAEQYVIPNYAVATRAMLHDLGVQRYDWIGTSMGALIGMVMAIDPVHSMQRFVVNDIGPQIERVALDRISETIGRWPVFPDYPALATALATTLAPFGPLSDEQRQHLIKTSCQRRVDGQWEMKADPKIGDAFRNAYAQPPVDLWPLWHAITQPTLILRGANSDLLSAETVEKMLLSHTHSQAVTIGDTGHAPALMDAPTIARIKKFLG